MQIAVSRWSSFSGSLQLDEIQLVAAFCKCKLIWKKIVLLIRGPFFARDTDIENNPFLQEIDI